MKIVLIMPYGTGIPPLGLLYLATVLKRDGYNDVHIVDLDMRSSVTSQRRSMAHLEKLLEEKPDIIGITATTPTFKRSMDIARLVRGHTKNLIFGGPHATIFCEKVLEKYPMIDVVVYGEGEDTITELVKKIENGESLKDVKGTIYRENGEIIKNEPRPKIEDLDKLPFPDRSFIDVESYHAAFSIMTSRGCPFMCNFCCSPVTGKIYRCRTPNNVVDEIQYLVNTYPKLLEKGAPLTIADENFNVKKERVKAICDEIVRRGLKMDINCINGLHVSTVDLEMFQKMKMAGCKNVWFGIESGNDEVLKNLGKSITKDMVREAVGMAQKAGIETVAGHFIIGLLGETRQSAMDTINFMKELNLDYAGVNQTVPLPNTPLWEWIKTHGKLLFPWKDVEDYENYNMDNTKPQFETPEFTAQDRIELYTHATNELDKIIRRRFMKPKMIMKGLKKMLKSPQDAKWVVGKFYDLFFSNDVRRHLRAPELKELKIGGE